MFHDSADILHASRDISSNSVDSDRGAALPPGRDGVRRAHHEERNHQGLDYRLITGPVVIKMTSRVRHHPRLGGLLNFYERAA